MKSLDKVSLSPQWKVPYQVLLTYQTTLKVEGEPWWIHDKRCTIDPGKGGEGLDVAKTRATRGTPLLTPPPPCWWGYFHPPGKCEKITTAHELTYAQHRHTHWFCTHQWKCHVNDTTTGPRELCRRRLNLVLKLCTWKSMKEMWLLWYSLFSRANNGRLCK